MSTLNALLKITTTESYHLEHAYILKLTLL
jgi:hypothetical protein